MEKCNSFSHILFDLDGTLTESAPGITASAAFALEKFGIFEEDKSKLLRFIGPPLMDSFRDFYGFSEENARKAMAFYRERYGEKGIFENAVYPKIPEMLELLRSRGKSLFVATSKPQIYMEKILDKFNLTRFFEGAVGSDIGENNSSKSLIIKNCLEKFGIEKKAAKNEILMVGDRKHDILGAKSNGIFCAGCLWGYGSRREFEENGADFILRNVEDLAELL